jgi:hypothetical protein
MSQETSHDPRDRLVRDKYFSLRPKPLERWLWQQNMPQAAERVFWLHWEEGMRNRDWCSQLSLKQVARLCCVDTSTVTRAYQVLKGLELIRREDPGRDPENPFQQATAVTEVRIPRELVTQLSASPNRPPKNATAPIIATGSVMTGAGEPPRAKTAPGAPESVSSAPVRAKEHVPTRPRPTRVEMQALWSRTSATERSRFFTASRNGTTAIEFDAETRLTPEDRGELLLQLEQMARTHRAPPPATSNSARTSPISQGYAKPRRLSPLEIARARKRVLEAVPATAVSEILRQVVWAVEEGALRRFEMPLAVNIALKKIRQGAWSRPNRMPPNWARLAALPETCGAA